MADILLVEDDELVRDMLEQFLTRSGHNVLIATNGDEASILLSDKNYEPDFMITDIIMPKKSGITLISEVNGKKEKMEIIAISGGGRLDPKGYLDLSESLGASMSFEKNKMTNNTLLMAINLLLTSRKSHHGTTTINHLPEKDIDC